jgi:hypothetical protein
MHGSRAAPLHEFRIMSCRATAASRRRVRDRYNTTLLVGSEDWVFRNASWHKLAPPSSSLVGVIFPSGERRLKVDSNTRSRSVCSEVQCVSTICNCRANAAAYRGDMCRDPTLTARFASRALLIWLGPLRYVEIAAGGHPAGSEY